LRKERAETEERQPQLLEPIKLHECRHTFASLLIDANANPKAIQTFMGHATIEMTFNQYGHLMPGSRDQARELVNRYLEAAVNEARVEAAAAGCATDAPHSTPPGSGFLRKSPQRQRSAKRIPKPLEAAIDRRASEPYRLRIPVAVSLEVFTQVLAAGIEPAPPRGDGTRDDEDRASKLGRRSSTGGYLVLRRHA